MSPFKWGKFRKILSMMHNPLSYSHSFLIFNKFPCPITIAFKHLIRKKSAVPPLRCKYLIAFKAEAKCLINRTAKQHLSSFHPLTSFALLMKNPLWLPAYEFRLWLCFWATSSCPLGLTIETNGTTKSGSNWNVNEIPMAATLANTAKEAMEDGRSIRIESIGKQAS